MIFKMLNFYSSDIIINTCFVLVETAGSNNQPDVLSTDNQPDVLSTALFLFVDSSSDLSESIPTKIIPNINTSGLIKGCTTTVIYLLI